MVERQHSEMTDAIINCFYKVYNSLGYGFLERVYEKSLLLELTNNSFKVEVQKPVKVFYSGEIVGEYFCDLLIEDKVLVEIKATPSILKEHEAQLLNYLKATNVEVGLVLNFGPEPQIRRKVFSNKSKSLFAPH